MENNDYRLDRDVLPVNYNLTMCPNLEDWTFTGYETIDLKVKKEVNEIILNASSLNITEILVNDESCKVEYNNTIDRITIPLSVPLLPGSGKLYLKFSGILNDQMKGFYRSSYKTDSKEEIRMAVTQFEPSDARMAFPCWDEPNIKATFDVSLIVPKTKTALSNMPEKGRSDISESLVKVEFERSPIMSTYLLAFIIGELDYLESHDSNGVKIRVYTAKDKSVRGKFALDVCCRTLPFYATYFGITYPLQKLDLVAIPDFASGAMENWGLITYRENMLLIDDKESSTMTKQVVALVVGHECAHMWFGNLVTMDWWTDLWLNEGFATWIEYLCVDYCYPEFDIWTNFVSDEYASGLNLDALKTSHPIQVTVHKPTEIDEIFDNISYSKGACIIRMINDFLTTEVFKSGLSVYLKRHQYQNAVTEDLWNVLSESSGLDVASIMDTWTSQTGFPVISVDEIHDEDGNTVSVILTQQRFLAHGEYSSDNFWIVPITICPMNDSNKILLKVTMEPNGNQQAFNLPSPEHGFVRINPGAVGFYHVKYQEDVLTSITNAISENKLSPCDRLGLVLDLFALARSGALHTTSALKVVKIFNLENNLTVWSAILGNLRQIMVLVDEMDSNLIPNVNRFLSQLMESVYLKLGWDAVPGESYNDTLLRPLLIRFLGKCNYKPVVEESFKRFNDHHELSGDNCQIMAADIRSAVYRNILKHGDETHLNKMMDILRTTDLQEERVRIMSSLGSVPHHLVSRVHQFAFTDEVRKQDKYYVLYSSVTDAESRSLFWEFLKSNWEEFKKQIYSRDLGDIIKGTLEDFVTQDRHYELKTFFDEHPCEVIRSIDQTLENIKINEQHLARDGELLKKFFGEF